MIDLLNRDYPQASVFFDHGNIIVGYSPDHSSSWVFGSSDSQLIINATRKQQETLVDLWLNNDGSFVLIRCGIVQ